MQTSNRNRTPGREDILDAAELLMAGKGIDSTSIADICRVSGLPVGSVYWHFGSKAGLIAAVMIRGAEHFFDRLPGLDAFKGSAAERFKQWFDSNTRMIADRPDFLRLHLSLSLLDEAESSARDISLSVRALALERLTLAFLPWLRELGIAEPERHSAEFAAMMLATVDGAFIAQQLGVATADAPMNTLYECLLARANQLGNSGAKLPE
jgi:AcrR family transcriptional regulator